MLACARLALVVLPFSRIARWMTRSPAPAPADAALARAVGDAVTVAARHVPWNAVCLPQAIAAKAMLARRGQASVVHFGAARSGGELTAHAWLTAGDEIVVGEAGIADVAPLARLG